MNSTTIVYRLARGMVLAILTLAVCLMAGTTGATATSSVPIAPVHRMPSNSAVPAGGIMDSAALEAFLDDLISRQLAESHIPGASVAVVKDGRLSFAKGYGYANLERHTPLVADHTLVRVGSIAKLFT